MLTKNVYRDIACGDVTKEHVNKTIKVAGWVNNIRDHGGIVFIDLRDHYGMVQITTKDLAKFGKLPKETVISVSGKVVLRSKENQNLKIKTGEVEVVAENITILGKATEIPPFEITDSRNVNEEVRLKYRYLDLRNPLMQNNLVFRSKVIQSIRKYMVELGFNEITTPILTVSSPEGARDYIVPSRLHQGKFYALPQAPQQFKQLLMVAGMDKYFQIAPCFRDEDARADRCPGEFYQLDMEMSFATQEDVFSVVEYVLPKIFNEYGKGKSDKVPFVRIPYNQAMELYGSDKPDLRNPLIIKNLTDLFKKTNCKVFEGQTVKAIAVKTENQPRSFYDNLTDFMVENGAKGLAWIKVGENNELTGPIVKFLSESEKAEILRITESKMGFSIFILAGELKFTTKLCGLLRIELGKRLNLLQKNVFKFCWITDFPMYEFDEENNKIDFCHNPFSMPQGGLEALNTLPPLEVKAYQYDIVLNGIELASGAVRNHDPEIMVKAFEIAGYDEKTIKEKFGALYNAFKFGAPPHAGIAPGIDRMIMILLEEQSIREVVAFPMNKKAQDLMMGAPGEVTEKQLREVHIKIR